MTEIGSKAGSGSHIAEPGQVDTTHGPILYLENVTVAFDGFKALDELCLYLREGELRCIIGPNGAGKTTLMDVITGKTRADTGTVFFGNTLDLTSMREHEIARAGVGRKFQKPTVFTQHTVIANLELARAGRKGVWTTLFAKLSGEELDRIEFVADEDDEPARDPEVVHRDAKKGQQGLTNGGDDAANDQAIERSLDRDAAPLGVRHPVGDREEDRQVRDRVHDREERAKEL